MNEFELDIITWYSDRFLLYTPVHFVSAKTPITNQSVLWIYDKLRGRFSYTSIASDSQLVFDTNLIPAFEDPQEAIFYELTWS